MMIPSIEKEYKELKTELKICKIGGLFLALYRNKEVPKFIMKLLENDNDLEGFFQFPLSIDEQKIPFPIVFEQTFEQIGNKSNIYHVLGIEENLSSEAVKEFIGYLQYARERLKAKPYSLVFWISPELEKALFFQAPDFHHWIFGTYDFTTISDDELNHLTASVNQELFDFKKLNEYFKKVIWQYENWSEVKEKGESFLVEPMERTDLYHYYVKSYCVDKKGKEQLLDNLLNHFIEDSKQNFLTLLGDFGTGKSSFSIYYFVELAKKYLTDNNERIPIFISLKDYKGKLNIEDFMIREFYDKFEIKIDFSIFQQLALAGKFIFFIDGFDEMASLTDKEITSQNLKELTKLSFENVLFITQSQPKTYKVNKVFLTSRTHYFLTESQEQDLLKADYTILYRTYATKSNYQITRIKLKEFNDNQIRECIQKYTNNEKITNQHLKIINDTYNLKELSTRPLLLEMIIKTMPTLIGKENINPVDLYRAYTNIWIKRDDWRSQMTPEGKRSFMWEMASKMFKLGGDFSLNHSKLGKPKNQYLKPNFEKKVEDYYKYETTTCSFLNRDAEGNYKFIHKSFMQYFIAELFYLYLLRKKNGQNSYYLSFNGEIKFFLKHIIVLDKDNLAALNLHSIDLSKTNLEGANLIRANLTGVNLRESNLKGANLKGANLIRANLTGANLKGANLIRANLTGANLKGANLTGANLARTYLIGANFMVAINITPEQIKKAKYWQLAIYEPEFRKKLGLAPEEE
ncbi:pentapeptide repeat-containing protein [Crocosphaera sp. XPORK-15E]|uniref:pentapeptide repeat-containing protein n=1 Tax=Crocosphaera sp. XPORK-15E TaxID=3110247 RepID=UPI002B20F9A7|nr:pentapeptide repeat-containing protein [Crocosphaera sp. XPORK-15E]MEA5536223.1 pentapeptide repeat-containing protein [Crocosphaera sp. XPORK-15E]